MCLPGSQGTILCPVDMLEGTKLQHWNNEAIWNVLKNWMGDVFPKTTLESIWYDLLGKNNFWFWFSSEPQATLCRQVISWALLSAFSFKAKLPCETIHGESHGHIGKLGDLSVFPQGMCHNWWLSPALKHVVPEQTFWDGSDRSRDNQCYVAGCGLWSPRNDLQYTSAMDHWKGILDDHDTWRHDFLIVYICYLLTVVIFVGFGNCAEQSDFVSTCKSSCRGVPDIARGFTRFHQP